jgi:prenyltransferase beta subunit
VDRRTFLTRGAGALLGLAGSSALVRSLAQDGNQADGMINDRARNAIVPSLAWLAARQQQDGAFGTGAYSGNVAVSALAGLALMSAGNQPGRGQYGDHVRRAVGYIIRRSDRQTGLLSNQGQFAFQAPMYGHGFATLFLAEVYGMVNEQPMRNDLRAALGRAINLIISSQNREGGWRYTPNSQDADLSVTICQIMALRAARNAGIAVPATTAQRCTEYVKRCQDLQSGGFRYQANFGGGPGFARTAAGVVALNSAGIYLETPRDGDLVRRGLDFLDRSRPGRGGGGGFLNPEMAFHYFYGHYYAVQAMWLAGGNWWRNWYPAIRDELLRDRRAEGCWQQGTMCQHYCTAMALIILQVPNNYLPILQR